MKKIIKLNFLILLTLFVLSCANNAQEVTKTPIPPAPYTHTNKAPLTPSLPLASKTQVTLTQKLPKQPLAPVRSITKENSKNVVSVQIKETKYPLTIMRTDNKEIQINEAPSKIIAFDSAAVEMLYSIGAGDKIIGTHSFVNYPNDTKNITKVGDAFNINMETILTLDSDLFYIFFERYVSELESNNLNVIYEKSLNDNIENIPERILMWGKIVNKNNEAYEVASTFEKKYSNIKSFFTNYSEGPSIFYDTGSLWTPGHNTLVGKTLDLLKLQNVAKDVSGYEQFSKEVLIKKDPQIIITADPDFFYKNKEFQNMTAVMNKRILSMKSDSLSIAGPRFIDGIEELIQIIYSPRFIKYIHDDKGAKENWFRLYNI